jgi:membrane-associated protease RseP (regulator of RpoE activity)
LIPAILFLATFCTTLIVGATLAGGAPLKNPADLILGLQFNIPLLSILMVHELGHYIAARQHGVKVTPPYFIPFLPQLPLPGTMGAIIKVKSPLPNRNALVDLGAAGPLAGAVVAIPVLMLGLAMSEVRRTTGGAGIALGESLLFRILSRFVLGAVPDGYDVFLHPMAYAGWLGLFVTMLNLIPTGQLDGGHIAYALFGDRYGEVARLVPYGLLLMGIAWEGWFAWAVLLFVIGTGHPRTMFDEVPLTRSRIVVGALAAALFLLSFTPVPLSFGGR